VCCCSHTGLARSGCWPMEKDGRRAGEAPRPGAVVRHRPQPQDRRPRCACGGGGPVRTRTLGVLGYDEQLEVLRMLVDRREELTRQRIQTVNRLQRLLAELTPGKVKKDITALQAKAILSSVRPRDLVGKTRKIAPGRLLRAAWPGH